MKEKKKDHDEELKLCLSASLFCTFPLISTFQWSLAREEEKKLRRTLEQELLIYTSEESADHWLSSLIKGLKVKEKNIQGISRCTTVGSSCVGCCSLSMLWSSTREGYLNRREKEKEKKFYVPWFINSSQYSAWHTHTPVSVFLLSIKFISEWMDRTERVKRKNNRNWPIGT